MIVGYGEYGENLIGIGLIELFGLLFACGFVGFMIGRFGI